MFCYLSTCVVFVFVCLCIHGGVLLNLHINIERLICNVTNFNSIDDRHGAATMPSASVSI